MSDPTLRPSPISNDEFDIGPLSWVKPEIVFALNRADEGITKFNEHQENLDLLRTVLPHLHQVTGALNMVGLQPLTLLSNAVEKLVEGLHQGTIVPRKDRIEALHGALKGLHRYLDGLVRGERHRPLILYWEYRSILAASGSEKVSAVDLFFPNLQRSPHFTDTVETAKGAELTTFLSAKRAIYQKELLPLLRGLDSRTHVAVMEKIVASIEVVQPAETRLLWWIAAGFMEGLTQMPAMIGAFHKQLCGRIDVEIKHQIDGTAVAPDRLIREFLFAIAHMPTSTTRLQEIHKIYRLSYLLPPEEQEGPESTRVKILMKDIKAQLASVQEAWARYIEGDTAALAEFASEAIQLNNFGQSLNNKSIRMIFDKLAEVGNVLSVNAYNPNDRLALEVASILLAARDTLDNFTQLGPNFDSMTRTQVLRVTAALRNRPLPGSGAMPIVDVHRTSSERELFSKLGQESLVILRKIEETLDGFFRDPAKLPDLEMLPNYFKQLEGALRMLENNNALQLLKAGKELVEKIITARKPVDLPDAELIADVFSHLELFVVAVQQGYQNPGELLDPLLVRLGVTSKPN